MFEALRDPNDVRKLLVGWEERFAWPVSVEKWRELRSDKAEEIRKWCNIELQNGYPQLLATHFMAYLRTGSRKAYENPYFARRRCLVASALGECLEHSDEKLDSVINGIWTTCEESYWGLSAHNNDFSGIDYGKHMLPDHYNQYLDLFAAQTAATMGIIWRLLYDRLLAVDNRIPERMEHELQDRIFTHFLNRTDDSWMGLWGQRLNNWTPWIVSSVLNAAAAVMKDDVRLSRLISKASIMLDHWLQDIPADGGLDEGIGYWNMAGGALLDCLECLRVMTGGRINYYQDEKVRQIGLFPLMSYIGKGWHFNYADCDARPMLDWERVYTYGLRTQQPQLVQLGASHGCVIVPPDTVQMNRVMDALFHDMPMQEDPGAPDAVNYDKLQVWSRCHDGLYASIKGGHNEQSHNHNDVGSFIVFYRGAPIIIDAGNAVYTRQTFSDERYSLWHVRSKYHNVPLIGDFEQAAGIHYRASKAMISGDTVTIDIAGAYPQQAGIDSLLRTARLGNTVSVQDRIALKSAQTVTWTLMSRPKPQYLSPGVIRLGSCLLRYPPQLTFCCEDIEITDARMKQCYPGFLYRMSFQAQPAMNLSAEFTISPCNDSPAE